MESYSLYQLNEYIRRVIALNFREPLWIEAELMQVRDSRGNWYLDLIQKKENGEEVIAQAAAAIWYRQFQFIRKKLGDVIKDLLQPGTQLRLKCTVDFNERYGLKLIVEDLDPNFTFGQLELARQKVIERLQTEGLMELNASLLMPSVLQSIAVISSSQAAGYRDFVTHLEDNAYGYKYQLTLYEASVQGQKLEKESLSAIREIVAAKDSYDAVVLIRGGGSKLDLSGYDNYSLARAIATSGIPFITGIGHEIDQSVVDMVACLPLKTPTAVADYLIEHNARYEATVEERTQLIFQTVMNLTRRQAIQLEGASEKMRLLSRSPIDIQKQQLAQKAESMSRAVNHLLHLEHSKLKNFATVVEISDPVRILQRGYAYIRCGKTYIDSVHQLSEGDLVDIHLKDGMRHGKII